MADPLEQAAEELWRTLPHCAGGDVCDGDLVATPHEPACPMYPDKEEPTIFEFAALVARSPAVRRELVKDNRQQAQHFDDWWQTDGKFFDPDTDDVPWFDKRKDLAEYAWHRGRAPEKAADIMTNVCQIIDVVKQEWGEAWSDWDQSVRDAISEWLKQYHGL